MLRGIYAAANAMRYRAHEVEIISNNIANVSTDGFKKDRTALASFGQMLISRINDSEASPLGSHPILIGRGLFGGCIAETTFIDFSQGPIRTTNNPLDISLLGPGFLAVETPSGTRYTRAGSLQINGNSELVTPDGYRVLDINSKPIILNSSAPIQINPDGQIIQNNIPGAKLLIIEFPDMNLIEKEGYTFFRQIDDTLPPPSPATSTTVEQGSIEGSNVNPIESMVQLIVSQRAYEAAARAVDMFNQSMTQVSGELGRLPG